MINRKLLILLATLNIVSFCNGYYGSTYHVTLRMMYKLLSCGKDLTSDGMQNAMRIDHLKNYYTFSPTYDIGQMMYFIRSKYARMIRVYTIIHDNHKKFTNAREYLDTWTEVQSLSMDIYNLIEMVEEYELTAGTRTTNLYKFMTKKLLSESLYNGTLSYKSPPPNLRQRTVTPKYELVKEKYDGINFDTDLEV